MELGIKPGSQAPPEYDAERILAHQIDQTRAADEAGFNSLIVGQHYVADLNSFQPFPSLGRLSVEAGSMRIGTGILILPLNHPVDVAENIATIDTMTDRPVVAGVGAGYRDPEFDSFGIDKATRGRRIEEGVELMRKLWTEDDVTYDGEFFSVDGISITPKPSQDPVVWIGANSKPAIERAARYGDSWFVNPHSTIGELRNLKEMYDDLCSDLGKDTGVPIRRDVFVSRNTEVLNEVREYLAKKYRHLVEWGQHEAMEDSSDLLQTFDVLAEDRFIIGEPEEVCEELERYSEELGVNEVIVRVHYPEAPFEYSLDCIEMIGDEVIPYI